MQICAFRRRSDSEGKKGMIVKMKCPKCGSENVNVQVVTESTLKNKSKGCAYWLFIGWWLELLMWLFLAIPMLLAKMFGRQNQKLVTKHKSMAVCQDCDKHWQV